MASEDYPEANHCSFCRRRRDYAYLLVQAGPIAICESCIGMCTEIVIQHFSSVAGRLRTIQFQCPSKKPESERPPHVPLDMSETEQGRTPEREPVGHEAARGLLEDLIAGRGGVVNRELLARYIDEQERCNSQVSSAPPGGPHRTANPEQGVGTAENPDSSERAENPAGAGSAI
jgi:hypothetical protein